jgi:hypothetical protein
VCFALAIVWASIAAAYASDLPVGFFVTAGSGILYAIGRVWVVLLSSRSRRTGRSTTPSALPVQ